MEPPENKNQKPDKTSKNYRRFAAARALTASHTRNEHKVNAKLQKGPLIRHSQPWVCVVHVRGGAATFNYGRLLF